MKNQVFAVLFITVLATTVGVTLIEPLMAIYSESLGATGLFIGIIFAAFTLSRGLVTPIIGKLSDHHGRRNFILFGLALYTISSFFYIAATSINTLIIVRLFQGMASAFVVPVAMAYIGDIAPKGQEGKYLGTFTISMFLGFGIGPILGGGLNHWVHINAAFVVMGLLGLVSLLLVLFMLPESVAHKKKKPTGLRELIRNFEMQEILLIRMVTAFGVAGFMVFFPLYAVSLGMNTAQIGIIITLNLLVTALPQRYFGKIADKHNKILMIVVGNLILGVTILFIPLLHNFYTLLALNLVMGLGGAIGIPANTALAAQFGKIHGMGSVMGLLQSAFSAGLVIGPLTSGIILDFAGLTMVFVYTASLVVAGTIAFYLFEKRNNQKEGTPTS